MFNRAVSVYIEPSAAGWRLFRKSFGGPRLRCRHGWKGRRLKRLSFFVIIHISVLKSTEFFNLFAFLYNFMNLSPLFLFFMYKLSNFILFAPF